MPDKKELALLLRRYVLHGLLIHQKSTHPAYRTMARASALDRLVPLSHRQVHSLYSPVQLARLILRHRQDLHAILPLPANNSYQSTLQRLSAILHLSEYLLNETPNDTPFQAHSTLCPNTFSKGSTPLE